MKIVIQYDSAWRNSFLDGDNNSPSPKGGRKFIASTSGINDKSGKNYIEREITNNTVMGLLCRLIGDQRKLYQSRQDENYYFKDLESRVTFKDEESCVSEEVVFLRNLNNSLDKASFTGAIKANIPLFASDFGKELWSVLALSVEELCDFVVNPTNLVSKQVDPLWVCEAVDKISGFKAIDLEKEPHEFSEKLLAVEDKLKSIYPELTKDGKGNELIPYRNGSDKIVPSRLYCSALYLQADILKLKYDDKGIWSARGGLSGFSKRGFTLKDFMGKCTTGGGKLVYGGPYVRKELIKGQGEVKSYLKKANGSLIINIDVDDDKGAEIERMIENAGVSCFRMGKKGLAYVSEIKSRRVPAV